jgi:broad specificity phosphatase PhoE
MLRDPTQPSRAVLILRHAARSGPSADWRPGQEESWSLTDEGRTDARRFGERIPRYSHLFLTHTRVDRTRETAELIGEGFRRRHPDARVLTEGTEPGLSLWSYYARDPLLLREWRERLRDQFADGWLRGQVPRTALAPADEAVADLVERMHSRLERSPKSSLILAISHDVHLQVIRDVLFRAPSRPQEPIGFLDGILLSWDPRSGLIARWRNEIARPGSRTRS